MKLRTDIVEGPGLRSRQVHGFLDRDLWPLCFNVSDGKTVAVANPHAKQLIDQDVSTNKDVTGKVFGQELYAAAQKAEGQITDYMFPKPAPTQSRCRR
jgi:hypothetical protein